MRVILDTNVLLSAFLIEGMCSRILRRARRKHISFILCESVLDETKRHLKNKFALADNDITFFVSILTEAADEVHILSHLLSGVCRDPDDDLILACAVETGCDFIVTGDKDLLVLKKFQDTIIISPRDFEMSFSD